LSLHPHLCTLGDTPKVVQVIENAYCNCATFADPQCLVTGSSDYTVRLWKVSRNSVVSSTSATHLTLSHIMRIHTHEVTCVTASRTWSIALSGSKDGSAALWDLNRGVYIRSIWHDQGEGKTAVNLVAINESTVSLEHCENTCV
jgi:WD40 repeat protein